RDVDVVPIAVIAGLEESSDDIIELALGIRSQPDFLAELLIFLTKADGQDGRPGKVAVAKLVVFELVVATDRRQRSDTRVPVGSQDIGAGRIAPLLPVR